MSDEVKKLKPEYICTLNSFSGCSERTFDKMCCLDVTPKYSFAVSCCKYRIQAVEICDIKATESQ